MASYTREQIIRWNSNLQNGFKLDLHHLAFCNEKEASKMLNLPDGKYLKAQIGWYSCWRESARCVRPRLHLSIWEDGSTEGMMVSHGMGAYVEITEQTYPRRNWNEIVKLTAGWTDEKILEAARQNIKSLENSFVIS